jgi:acyl phosphate:glycerol-3-phosphate acyltransferase
MEFQVIQFLFLVVVGYLMGSVSSAIIVCRTFALPDPRSEGSKNPGATNVLRIAGKKYAALVMLGDVLKGTIPVVIAKALDAEPVTVAFTALAAVVGHIYPVFFEFKGGKGVATAIGALLGFHFIIGVMVAATWLLVANFSRYSSLASIVSIALAPFYTLLLIGRIDIFPPLFFMVLLIIYKHKNNITRLMDGDEPKIKLKHSVIEEIMEDQPKAITEFEESAKEINAPFPIEIESKPRKETKPKAATKKAPAKKTVKAEEPAKKAPRKPAKPKELKTE